MKIKNLNPSGWVQWKAICAYLSSWSYACSSRWMHPYRSIFLSLALCLSSSFALAQENTNHTLAAGEAVKALAELPGNPLAHLATKADLANLERRFVSLEKRFVDLERRFNNLEVRLIREMADFKTEVTTEIIQRTAGLPNTWNMWSATALLLLGMLFILVGMFVLYRQGQGRA